MDSSALAAYELIAIVTVGATLAGLLVGYTLGCRVADKRELVTEEEIEPLFSTDNQANNPLTWDHLPMPTEQEQTL